MFFIEKDDEETHGEDSDFVLSDFSPFLFFAWSTPETAVLNRPVENILRL